MTLSLVFFAALGAISLSYDVTYSRNLAELETTAENGFLQSTSLAKKALETMERIKELSLSGPVEGELQSFGKVFARHNPASLVKKKSTYTELFYSFFFFRQWTPASSKASGWQVRAPWKGGTTPSAPSTRTLRPSVETVAARYFAARPSVRRARPPRAGLPDATHGPLTRRARRVRSSWTISRRPRRRTRLRSRDRGNAVSIS